MPFGPIEIVVIAFPGNRFNGSIVPELARLVETGTISVVDGLLVTKDADGECSFVEFEELGADAELDALSALLGEVEGLISDEDVAELTAELEPNSSAALLVFEHTWVKPLRDAIVSSGGVLADSIRVPGPVVDEVMAAVAELV